MVQINLRKPRPLSRTISASAAVSAVSPKGAFDLTESHWTAAAILLAAPARVPRAPCLPPWRLLVCVRPDSTEHEIEVGFARVFDG